MSKAPTVVTELIHGENAVVPVKELPSNLTWHEESMSIIGHSETGHHHVLQPTKGSKTELAEYDDKLYIRVTGQADVSHQKNHDIHETVRLDEGTFVVTHKTEYDPFAQIRRAVYD